MCSPYVLLSDIHLKDEGERMGQWAQSETRQDPIAEDPPVTVVVASASTLPVIIIKKRRKLIA